MGDRSNGEVVVVTFVSKHNHSDRLAGGHVLDDGGYVEVASVPDQGLPHLDKEVAHHQLTGLRGCTSGMEATNECPHSFSVLMTYNDKK